jgi:hypothetical protein
MDRADWQREFLSILKEHKDTSAKAYTNFALRMVEELYGYDSFKLEYLVNFKKISDYINKLPMEAGKRKGVSLGLLMLVKSIKGMDAETINCYEKLYKHIKDLYEMDRLGRQWTFDEEPEVLWSRIKGKVASLPRLTLDKVNTDGDLRKYMRRYIGLLYTLHPPIRHSEWISCCFMTIDDGKTNHVNLNKEELVIYDQKSRGIDVKRNKLSHVLVENMKEMRQVIKKFYSNAVGDYVLPKYDTSYGKPECATISEKIEIVLGYNLNCLRKIYEGVVYKKGTPETYLYVVNALGHSVDTSRKEYIKSLKRPATVEWPTHQDHFVILEEFMHSGEKLTSQIKDKSPPKPVLATLPSQVNLAPKPILATLPSQVKLGIKPKLLPRNVRPQENPPTESITSAKLELSKKEQDSGKKEVQKPKIEIKLAY